MYALSSCIARGFVKAAKMATGQKISASLLSIYKHKKHDLRTEIADLYYMSLKINKNEDFRAWITTIAGN